MIGLHISKDQFYIEEKHKSIQKECADLFVTLSYHHLDYRQVFFENDDICVFVEGWIFNSSSYTEQASFIAGKYLEHGDKFSEYIEGQFNILLWNKTSNTVFFTNDIFAFRKHFMILESFIISTDLEFLYGHLESIKFNHVHIQKNLNQNRLVDIEETFVEEINMIRPASIIDFKKHNYYSLEGFEKQYTVKNITPESFVKKVRRNISNVHRGENILLELSGGMDARFLLENFKALEIPTKTLSYGSLQSDELKIAKLVAQQNEVKHKEVSYQPSDFIKYAATHQFTNGGLDIFVQSVFQKTSQELKFYNFNNYVLDSGIALDPFIGGTQISKQFDASSNGFSDHVFDLSINDIYTSQLRMLSLLPLRRSLHREFMEDRYSMFSYASYYLMKSIPFSELENYKFYDKVAEISIINSREIDIHGKMLPLYKISDAANKKKLEEREINSLKYFLRENKLKPHNRYYSDFDMWLRADSTWLELINKTILNKQAHLHSYIEISKIQELVQEHKNGVKNNMRLLIRLISTELFFQETVNYFKKKSNG